MTAPRLCRLCGERPVGPSMLRRSDYRCTRCRHRTPAAVARNRRYYQTASRKAVAKRQNARRIYVGQLYHSTAKTADDAARINAHIKSRLESLRSEGRIDA